MDDGLTSVASVEQAVILMEESRALCAAAGLRLHKFVSNKREVLSRIPESERDKSLKEIDLRNDPLPIERALGVTWCIERDAFNFRMELKNGAVTRRRMLAVVSSIFDPVGFFAPVLLQRKKILQDLCKEKASWDDPVSEHLRSRWDRWKSDILNLDKCEVRRCLLPNGFGLVKKVEMHHFSDASKIGYDECSYVRVINQAGDVHCSFLMGKARVTPLKHISVPRLELTAALVAAKMSAFLERELKYDEVTHYYWVDSKVVIGYVKNEAKRFHVYVANRVQQIRDLSSPDAWFYVESQQNPSDVASRASSVAQLMHSTWLHGPAFLWETRKFENMVPCSYSEETKAFVEKEMRKATNFRVFASSPPKKYEMGRLLDHISSWHKAKKSVAICLRFFDKLSSKVKGIEGKPVEKSGVMVKELQDAEMKILQGYQRESFEDEYWTLVDLNVQGDDRQDYKLRKRRKVGSLSRLDPYIDGEGLMRVGGRIQRSNLIEEVCHPVILPKRGHITEMIIRHYHNEVSHLGRGMTHNHLRQNGYWIVGGSSTVSGYIRNCVTCRMRRGSNLQQKMANLPPERVAQEPPFTYCGVDLFGPFHIKEKRSVLKRYGVLFTCLSSRAIHLETANSLDTSSFLNALRRFVGRRGPVKQLRSDCGTNIVGASNSFQKAFDEMDHEKIGEFLLRKDCDWIRFEFNTPCSSHMGSVWERQIRTVRSALGPLLVQHGGQIDDETFRTLMVEIENIVNSRPLTIDNINDPEHPEPLTPNHLLTMKLKLLLPPPGRFQHPDVYAKSRWRRVQCLANQFWLRWRKEYLQNIQSRKKWISSKRNLKAGDIVLVNDDDLQRNQSPIACVEAALPSSDGLVRKVRLRMANKTLNNKGIPLNATRFLVRPIHKLVLILAVDEFDPRRRSPTTSKDEDCK